MFPRGPLSLELGRNAGRVAPSGATPAEGSHAFVLGSDLPGQRRTLRVGDSLTVRQAADFTLHGLLSTTLVSAVSGSTLAAVAADWDLTVGNNVTGGFPDGEEVRVGDDPDHPLVVGTTHNIGHGTATKFTIRLGAGGSLSAGATVPAGKPVWVLTSALTSPTSALLRMRAHVRGVRAVPAGVSWRFGAYLNGAERYGYDLSSGDGDGDGSRETTLSDVALPLQGLDLGATAGILELRLTLLGGAAGEVEAELPAAYLDALVLDADPSPRLINRNPEPGQTDVAVGGAGSWAQGFGLAAELTAPSWTTPGVSLGDSLTSISIWVNGVLAMSNLTGDAAGYTTSVSSRDGGRTARFATVLGDPLPPNSTIPMRLRAVWPGGAVDESWTFDTEDLLAPTLLSAQARDEVTVRVSASEPLLAEDPAGAHDALNLANWTLLLLSTSLDDGLPAVTPSVVAVALVDGSTYDLALSEEMTAGARYAVAAGPLSDLSFEGNLMAPPGNEAPFSGYTCPQPPGRAFDLLSFLPDMNVDEDETQDLRRFVACLQEVTGVLLCMVDRWTDILDPDTAPEPFLRLMLADLGNPFSFALSEVDERRLLRVLVPIYQQKGTDPGIINAVRFFMGVEVTILVPAFDDTWVIGESELGSDTWLGTSDLRQRLSFWIVSPGVLAPGQRDQITKIATYMKRAETHLLGILEPAPPPALPDHWELSLSLLGAETTLH